MHSQDGGQILVCHAVFQITNACTPRFVPAASWGILPMALPVRLLLHIGQKNYLPWPAFSCMVQAIFYSMRLFALMLLHDAAVVSVRVASLNAAGSLPH